MSLYGSCRRHDTSRARSWNVRFLSTSLSFRIMYEVVIYCLVCMVNFDLLYFVCMFFVGVENHLCFNQLIASLNLKSFLSSSRVIPWANELETKEWSPFSEVNVCSLFLRLRNMQTLEKFYSMQYWENKVDKLTQMICWLHKKVVIMSC